MSLSTYIKNDLVKKIREGSDGVGALSLTRLAREYGVSITPVRAAVDRLVAEGVVRRLPNRRLEVDPAALSLAARVQEPAPPPTPGDREQILLKEVMLASLSRRSVYLREERLAQKHGFGRSIVRHTFSRFSGAGLIEHVPRRGWLVHPFRKEDMRAYLTVREILETKALELARPRLVWADLEKILAGNPIAGPGTPPSLDNELHRYMIEKSGNRYIRDFFRQYVARYYTELFDYATPEAEVVVEMALQHRRILEALIARSWSEARWLLKQHIRAQARVLERVLAHGGDGDEAVTHKGSTQLRPRDQASRASKRRVE